MMRAAAIVLLVAVGCAPESSSRTATDRHGELTFDLISSADAVRDDTGTTERSLWRLGSVTVTTQRIPRTRYNEDATLEEIADSLATRYELGEVAGDLSHGACAIRGHDARCLHGHLGDGDGAMIREGFLLAGSHAVYLVEVLALPGARTVLERQVNLLRDSVRLKGFDS